MIDEVPTTRAEFEARLATLLAEADDNAVDVRGGVDVRTGGSRRTDWTVEITRFRNPDE